MHILHGVVALHDNDRLCADRNGERKYGFHAQQRKDLCGDRGDSYHIGRVNLIPGQAGQEIIQTGKGKQLTISNTQYASREFPERAGTIAYCLLPIAN